MRNKDLLNPRKRVVKQQKIQQKNKGTTKKVFEFKESNVTDGDKTLTTMAYIRNDNFPHKK